MQLAISLITVHRHNHDAVPVVPQGDPGHGHRWQHPGSDGEEQGQAK